MPVDKPVIEMTNEELDQVINADNQPQADPPSPEPEPAPAPEGQPKPEPADEMKQMIERLNKQLADSQSMIGRQANELGQLRKQLTDLAPKPPSVTPDQVLTDPVGATKQLVKEEMAERERRKQEEQEQFMQIRTQTATLLANTIPDIIELLPDMAKIAEEEDGVPKEYVERFKADPLSESPFITIQLAKRARMKRELLELKSKNGQLESKPGELIDKINQAAKTRPAVSGSHGRTSDSLGSGGLTREQIRKLSDKELDELIKAG